MAFPPPTFDKWGQACRVAIGLAAVALAAGDPVGFVVATASGARSTAPRARRSVLEEGARLFADVEPGGSEPLLPALRSMPAARGVRVAIISDFLGDSDDLLALARQRASAGGEVYAVHIVANEELELGDAAVLATDPEAEEVRRPLAASTRAEYQRAFALWRGELARAWRTAAAAYTEVVTNETAARAVRRVTSAGSDAGVPAQSAER
jgi:uncharacterized protein (DUF58 family)